jgi:hypothetical protein
MAKPKSPGKSASAPGQMKKPGESAKSYAPGQTKKK